MIALQPVLRFVIMVVLLLATCHLYGCESLGAPPARSTDVGRRPPGFTESYLYTDGVEIQVVDVWAGRRLGLPVVELSVTVRNGSAHAFDAWMRGELRHGTYRLPAARYLIPPGPDDSGDVQMIAPGEYSDPYRLSFVIPDGARDDVVFAFWIDAGVHDPAVFVGRL